MTMLEPARSAGNVLADLIDIRLNRRKAIGLGIAGGATVWLAKVPGLGAAVPQAAPALALEGLAPVADTIDAFSAAPGLTSSVLIGWGDPVVAGAPPFDVNAQTAAKQAQQFGYNCDYTALFEVEDGYLLWVNHEYTTGPDMFPAYVDPATALVADLKPFVDIELEAHGGSVVRLERNADHSFTVVADPVNRRITGNTTFKLSGPAVGVLGTDTAIGMFNNCAGGYTPWGTVLTCEENFNQYFANVDTCADAVAKADHEVYGLPGAGSDRGWERVYPNRFDTTVAPREAWKYGYVVEIDPTDPASVPVKHTALGRVKHEAANTWVAPDGRVVVYSGDDERGQYFYKFVTDGVYDATDRAANLTLLDSGTLYVAKLADDGTGEWLPLVYAGNESFWNGAGFASQGDLCVHTRQAALALGATAMDRPEDIEVNPVNGAVYMALTNNSQRGVNPAQPVDAANPRTPNKHGHILEFVEDGNDHAATTFAWDVFMLCGHGEDEANLVASPAAATGPESTYFAGWTGPSTIISCPDNLAFDQAGNMIVGTDGMPGTVDVNDGVFVVPTAGASRGRLVQLAAVPAGAESTGPFLSADDKTLLVAVQHPGEGAGDGIDPTQNPVSRWPDSSATGAPAVPRPSVVQVVRADGGKIVPTATAKLVPLAPERLLDTRNAVGVATTTPLGKDAILELDLGVSSAQLSSLAAVVLNTTVDQAADRGYVTVYPAGAPQPVVSALNLDERGQVRANLVTTAVGNSGSVAFFLDQGGHLIADLNAIYSYVSGSRDGRYQPTGPTRVLDTRAGLGAANAKVAAGGVLELTIAGVGGVPANGAAAVVLNVTATQTEGSGYVSVYPDGNPPIASNLNYPAAGRDAAGQAIVPVGADGKVRLFTFAAAHLVADVAGWFTDDTAEESDRGLFVPITSARALDTRNGIGAPAAKVAAGGTISVQITGFGGVPTEGVAAVVANLALVEADKPGYVTAWPSGAPRPEVSSVNGDRAGAVVANHITIPVGADGKISLFNDAGGHLLVDVTGWYVA